jgi:hypothetical protein
MTLKALSAKADTRFVGRNSSLFVESQEYSGQVRSYSAGQNILKKHLSVTGGFTIAENATTKKFIENAGSSGKACSMCEKLALNKSSSIDLSNDRFDAARFADAGAG